MAVTRRRPIRDRLIEKLIDDVAGDGTPRSVVEDVVADLNSERPILDLLRSIDWEELIAYIKKLIALLS